MNRTHTKWLGLVVAVIVLAVAPSARAQYPGYVTNSNDTGLPSYGSFISSNTDTVNILNGGLSIRIPMFSRKGRGMDLEMHLQYESKFWVMDTSLFHNITTGLYTTYYTWRPDPVNAAWNMMSNIGGGTDNSQQLYTCEPEGPSGNGIVPPASPVIMVNTNWVFISADGSKHPVPIRSYYPYEGTNPCLDLNDNTLPMVLTGQSKDGQVKVDVTNDTSLSHSGIVLTWPDGSHTNPYGTVSDTNGNLCCTNNSTNTFMDTLGRPILSLDSASTASQYIYDYTDSNGQTRQITLNFTKLSLTPAFPTTSYDQYHVVVQPTFYTINVISSIVLPNGLSYTFSYIDPATGQTNPFGEVMQITLPTGGYVKYKWVTVAQSDPGPIDPSPLAVPYSMVNIDSRQIAQRIVSEDGTAASEKVWTYNTNNGTITDPLGNYEVHFGGSCTINNFIDYYPEPPFDAGVTYYNSAGKALKSVSNTWACDRGAASIAMPGMNPPNMHLTEGMRNMRVIRTTTTLLDTNQVSKTETDFNDCYSYTNTSALATMAYTDCRENPTETREYDFGAGAPGSLLRKTDFTYLHNSNSTYLNAHIWDRVTQKTVYDGSGNQMASTTTSYDTTGITTTSGVPMHDYTNYSSSNTVRGNATLVSRWLNTTGGSLTTTNSYSDVGNLVSTTDPGGHTYNLSYADNFTDSSKNSSNTQGFLTSVTSPTTANGVSHIEGKQYYYFTGLTAAVCGQNASSPANCTNATSSGPDFAKYTYDLMGRPLTVTHGDGGVTNFTFQESSLPFSVSSSSAIDSTNTLVNTAIIDGLGRVTQTQLNSDPDGVDYVDTVYDAAGRKSTVSNPHRSSSAATDGITTYVYDGLGRTSTVIPPDGTSSSNNVTTVYSGNSVMVTDQAGKVRRSFTDGLGRLIEVDEPGAVAGASASNGYITLSGTLQTFGVPGSGAVTITGGEQWTQVEQYPTCTLYDCGGDCLEWSNGSRDGSPTQVTVYDSGLVFLTVNGHRDSAGYGANSTPSTIASALASAINGDSSASVTATAAGAVVTLTAKSNGTATDYSWSSTVQFDSTDFSSASFGTTAASGALTGGVNTFPDTGTVWVSVGGNQASATYGSGSTASSVAGALATAINNASSYPVTASASGATINFTEKTQGSTPALSAGSSTSQPSTFAGPSFTAAAFDEFLDATNTAPPASLLNPLVTLYSYDALDNLTCVEQHGNVSGTGCSSASSNDASSAWRVRRFTYDSVGRLLTAKNPESGTITYTYDADGDVLTKTDARSIVTTMTYDQLHRLTQKSYSDGTHSVIIGYDGATISGCSPTLTTANGVGRRTAICDAAGWEAWSYDTRGHVVDDRRNTNSVTKDTIYAYNFAGAETSVTYPSGHTISYSYNAASQVTSASDVSGGITYASNAHYAAPGELLSLQNSGSAIVSTLFYNSRLQPCRISVKNSSGNSPGSCTDSTNLGNVLDYTYAFSYGAENNGNVASITNNINTARSQIFTYDELNRITTAKTQATSGTYAWGLQFGYDPWANLLSASVSQGSAYALSASSTGQNWLSNYSYDASGNMLNDGTNTYTFDAESQLKTAAGLTYTYDGDGNRVQKSNGKLYWHGGGSDSLDETDASGNLTDEYIFFGGKRIARRDPSNNVDYYFADHLGTAHVVTNSAGAIQDDSDFYPFGGERPYLSSSGNNYKFTGKERDAESGLDDFGARYYSSTSGRFVSSDEFSGGPVDAITGEGDTPGPLPYANITNPQSLNKYVYTWNNPLRYVDPDGHDLTVAPSLQGMVDKIASESPTFKAELDAAKGSDTYNINIAERAPAKVGESKGDAQITIDQANGVITVNIHVTTGDEGTTEHEVGHGNDARTNTEQHMKDNQAQAKDEKNPYHTTDHLDYPNEKRAENFRKKVEKEREATRKKNKKKKNGGAATSSPRLDSDTGDTRESLKHEQGWY